MTLKTARSNLDNGEHEDFSFTQKRTNVMKNDDESDNGTTKSPSVTVAQNPTKKD